MESSPEEEDVPPVYIYREGAEIKEYKDAVKVSIVSGVTSIGDRAFLQCTSLASIEIPSSVKTIGNYAFYQCISLSSITIPSSVTTIGEWAFVYCNSLQHVKIPSSVKTLGVRAFAGCETLTSVEIPSSVTKIGDNAFSGCLSLASAEIPSSVSTVPKSAFYLCKSLASVVIPKSVTTIGEYAFSSCDSLASIEIPSSVIDIDSYAFEDCISLASVVIPSSVTTIGDHAFCGCTALACVGIPSSVTSIGDMAFGKCTSLASIVIPSSVTSIGRHAFQECKLLEKRVGAGKEDVAEWLSTRFNRYPVHSLCYNSSLSSENILSCITSYPDTAKALDGLRMSALHILLMNESLTPEAVEILLKAHPLGTTEVCLNGMYPLHLAAKNPNASLKLIQMLSNTCTEDGRLVLTVADDKNDLPCALAIRMNSDDEVPLHLFERYPIKAFNLKTKQEKDRLERICEQYFKKLEMQTEASITSFDSVQSHGWVSFVNDIGEGSENARKCIQLIEEKWPIEVIRFFAYCKDRHGRLAIENAMKDIRVALENKLLVFGRYDLVKGPPLHKSPTSVVVKAYDMKAEDEYRKQFNSSLVANHEAIGKYELRGILEKLGIGTDEKLFEQRFTEIWDLNQDGQITEHEFVEICKLELDQGRPREVVLKFMRHKEHYEREVQSREQMKALYVVGISHTYTKDTVEDFHDQLASVGDIIPDIHDFEYIIVMPFADRNLDTIFRSERPRETRRRAFATDLAYAIQHVHRAGLIHGDLKLLNVVRFNGRLRLIDLDAAVKKGSPIGAKFSSGVLPPEMIAELDIDEYKKFMSYFKHIKENEKNKEYWEKLHKNFPYFVRTFYTKSVLKDCYVGGDVVTREVDEAQTNGLPYDLVKADATIDIWSFGVILFSLYTGEPLFDVNRDDDGKDAKAMQELKNWNNSKKKLKLKHKKLQDPLVNALLSKMLSPSPSERYTSMDEVLLDNYFTVHTTAEYIEAVRETIRSDVRILLEDTREAILRRLRTSTTVICKAVFEAKEVSTPTCFVIRKDKLPPPPPDSDSDSEEERVTKISETLAYTLDVLEKVKNCVSAPIDFAADYIKSQFVEESMWLYLIDEYTGEPVHSEEVYPLEISVRSENAKNFLPVMALGMQSLALANGAVGLVNMFYPACPAKLVPEEFMDKVKAFIEESNQCGIIQRVVDGEQHNKVTARGLDLRELEAFILKEDTARTFCGLQMVCDSDSGKAMWVTKESAELIEIENRSDLTDPSQQVIQLKEELKEVQQSKKDAETAKECAESAKEKVEDDLALKVQTISGLEQSVKDAETAKRKVEEDLRDLKLSNTKLSAELQVAKANASCCVTM